MLPIRLLPPQFLVPAWSATQLRQVLQRAHKSSIKTKEPKRKEPSLFEELFPEEKKQPKVYKGPDFGGKGNFDKLPPLQWSENEPLPKFGERDRRGKQPEKIQWYSALGRDTEIPARRAQSHAQPGPERRHSYEEEFVAQEARRRAATVLVLRCASKTLEESDFIRLSSKGEHIEGWTSGIIKVIPGRDTATLEPLGHYFILFASIPAANAYLDQVRRLHIISKAGSSAFTTPLPPSLRRRGEDIQASLLGFTLVPGALNGVRTDLVKRPYRSGMIKLMTDGGPAAIAGRKNKAEDKVLFSVDQGAVTPSELRLALGEDGARRNLQWELAGGENDLLQLYRDGDDPEDEGFKKGKRHSALRSARYLISFKDQQEARRFVREWHRRPFPITRARNQHDELLPTVNAEILW